MVEAAQMRGTLNQLDRFNAAAMAFKNKYNGLPGDLMPSQAAAFGFATRSGTQGRGDGDGSGGDWAATAAVGGLLGGLFGGSGGSGNKT